MFKKLIDLIYKNKKIVKFCVVGFSGAVIDFGILAFLVEIFACSVLLANIISFTTAMISNFLLNKFWTWRDKNNDYTKQFLKFTTTSVVGLLISTGLMWASLTIGLYYLLAKVISSVVVAFWNYLVNNHWTFKPKN